MKSILPVVMAGVLGIYGLIIAVIISTNITPNGYTLFQGYAHLSSGLACGLSGLAAGTWWQGEQTQTVCINLQRGQTVLQWDQA